MTTRAPHHLVAGLLAALAAASAPAMTRDQVEAIAAKVGAARDEAATAAHTLLVRRGVLTAPSLGSFETRVEGDGSYEAARAACELVRIGAATGQGDFDFLSRPEVVDRIRADLASIRARLREIYGDGSEGTMRGMLYADRYKWGVAGVFPVPSPVVRFRDAVYEQAREFRKLWESWETRDSYVYLHYFQKIRSRSFLTYAYGESYLIHEQQALGDSARRMAERYQQFLGGLDEADSWLERDLAARRGAVTAPTGTSTWSHLPPGFGGLEQN